MNQEKIGNFIREMRTNKKMTQQELAEKIGVTDRAISKWENGRGTPDIALLIPLAKELNVTVLELLNGEKTEDQNNAVIGLIEQTNKKIRIWKRLSLILLNIILFVLIIISVFGYIVPLKYENSNTQGIARLQSDSMKPKFKAGDGIVYNKINISKVKKDDIVIYYYMDSDGSILANTKAMHRVMDINKDNKGNIALITKGDNNLEVDKVSVTKTNYLGIYSHKTSPITNMFLREESYHIAPIYFMLTVYIMLVILCIDFIQIKKKHFNK